MPGLDGTGPRGEGPRTGGGRGFCPPNATSTSPTSQVRYGRGLGPCGRGLARGFRGGRGYGGGWGRRGRW